VFVFADTRAYEDIMLQKEHNPEFDALVIRRITDFDDLVEHLRTLDPEEEIAVFLNALAYRGSILTVVPKIAADCGRL